MDCTHENTTKKPVKKEILGSIFECETLVCTNCGAYLRDASYDASYMSWLENIYKTDRNKFQIQCHLSNKLIQCAERFLTNYPSVSLTFFFKSLVVVYLVHVDGNEKLATQLDEMMDKQILNTFRDDAENKRVNIQFKPKMIIELAAISKMTSLKPAQIVESCVVKLMTTLTSQDDQLKGFWETEIMRYVDSMLKAA